MRRSEVLARCSEAVTTLAVAGAVGSLWLAGQRRVCSQSVTAGAREVSRACVPNVVFVGTAVLAAAVGLVSLGLWLRFGSRAAHSESP